MAGIATNWNVIVVGSWNRAILTPAGIVKRLYCLEPGTPTSVEVPLDGPGPFRITHDNITVVPAPGRLEVSPSDCTVEQLNAAAEIAVRAISSLPETPFVAAGVNIRYHFDFAPDRVLSLVDANVDQSLSDAGFEIAGRELKRSIRIDEGLLNVAISVDPEQVAEVTLNFHQTSSDPTVLQSWIKRSEDLATTARHIMESVLGLELEVQTDE